MVTVDQITNVEVLDAEEGRSLLDRQAQRYLGMRGNEFARAWKAGEFAERDDAALVRVAMLLPFGRQDSRGEFSTSKRRIPSCACGDTVAT